MWNRNLAIDHLNRNARPQSTTNCAKFVRLAIAAGGVQLTPRGSAKDYGISLLAAGFRQIAEGGWPEYGDVAVIQPIAGHPHGHMAMFNGRYWVSDFVQVNGYYPGQGYRSARPPVTFYRLESPD